MAIAQSIGIDMPNDFPTAPHNAVCAQIGPTQRKSPVLFGEHAAGWNAVARWFKSAADADNAFTPSIRQSTTPPFDERQRQETALFSFFVMGYSTIESFAYALFALGAMLKPTDFPMSTPGHLKAIYPKSTAARFATSFAGEPVEAAMSALVADPMFDQWGLIRNILAHRSSPSRQGSMTLTATSGGGSGSAVQGATAWQMMGGLTLDDRTTSDRRTWLAGQLTACVSATETFAKKHFP